MKNSNLKRTVKNLLDIAGVSINGENSWDIQVHEDRTYQRILAEGSLGLGESYMDGWWDCEKLDGFFYRILKADLSNKVKGKGVLWDWVKAKFVNMQDKIRAFEVGEKHYDVGDELYRHMLGKRMVYTCGYWKDVNTLDEAQESKLELTCRKIGLEPGMKILDIGCGWGSFAKYAAEEHGAEVVGITISKNQVELGNELCQGLPVEIRLQDYRDVTEKFDRIVSLGMFEHVGPKNYRTYMEKVHDCLNDDGLFLLHTIGANNSKETTNKWVSKYIFPNGVLPTAKQITSASEELFVLEDWHNFRADYDKTLMAWYDNFDEGWEEIKGNYNERFKRMWDYYLLGYVGLFRAGKSQLWQIVFSKGGVEGGYESVR